MLLVEQRTQNAIVKGTGSKTFTSFVYAIWRVRTCEEFGGTSGCWNWWVYNCELLVVVPRKQVDHWSCVGWLNFAFGVGGLEHGDKMCAFEPREKATDINPREQLIVGKKLLFSFLCVHWLCEKQIKSCTPNICNYGQLMRVISWRKGWVWIIYFKFRAVKNF